MNNIPGITFTYSFQTTSQAYLPNITLIYAHPECDCGADLKQVLEDHGIDVSVANPPRLYPLFHHHLPPTP